MFIGNKTLNMPTYVYLLSEVIFQYVYLHRKFQINTLI